VHHGKDFTVIANGLLHLTHPQWSV